LENHLSDCLERVIEKSSYSKKLKEFKEWNQTHKHKKGIGISIGYHGGGYTGNGEKILNSEVKIIIEKECYSKKYSLPIPIWDRERILLLPRCSLKQ